MLSRLCQVFARPIPTSEGEKLILLNALERFLHKKNYQRYPRAVTVYRVFYFSKISSCKLYKTVVLQIADPKVAPDMPSEISSDAPVSVAYVSQEGIIAKQFLLIEKKVAWTIEKPTCCEAIGLLHGVFYCFHRDFPLVSKMLFYVFEHALLGKTNLIQTTRLFDKLMKAFDDNESDVGVGEFVLP